ncbi:hypothetical protein OSTOST_09520, partial [Ostertagia ostertagi]
MHFNSLNENCQTEILTWGVDSNVQVPPHYSTEASIIIEEMNYKGSYSVVTKLSGNVTISIRRRRDGALVLPIRVNIVEVFLSHLESPHCRKEVCLIHRCIFFTKATGCGAKATLRQHCAIVSIA